jgi:hypothetical protein
MREGDSIFRAATPAMRFSGGLTLPAHMRMNGS